MFKSVPPDEVLDLWAEIEPGLSVIRQKCKAPWTERQIRGHLLQARASLFVHEHGFLIIEKCFETWTNEPYLNAWLMWMKPGEGVKRMAEVIAWLDAMQKFHKCAWWQFGSPHEGWSRAMRPYCEKTLTVWRRRA